ncbi:MAG: bifunctional diaminohydroxyphosphoribosylaminopyrimidine deaminase/5-amino-6-(5-phosphoribosylamino)uracil reductase RibD [Armatimonadetes bacterium]|nr:bifunctional diaminohydroxyphosphoribosylaminopyrimidine deaminase/5-amino-6-(5-phosphoribosylamino)uracil reductase RibD [Armatimonadota bacterium]
MTPGPADCMKRALRLAARAKGRTSPNPMVGAVLVRDGTVVGEGYHPFAGAPHAEALALREAGERARGAVLYVTLEPCSHYGRTPPCADAVIEAGVTRVVAAMEDPNPLVFGRGFARLREAGIAVEVGLCGAEARRLNEVFITYITRNRPFVILKYAMTLDGKIATAAGDARWVTGEKARGYVHRLRAETDAILVGLGTVFKDDPLLTARRQGARNPARIVLDSRARIPLRSRLLATLAEAPVWVAVTEQAPRERVAALESLGAEVICPGSDASGRVAWKPLLGLLGERGVMSLLVEGGGSVHASALESGVGDKVMAFIAPKIVGGAEALSPVEGQGVAAMAEAHRLSDVAVRRFGEDILIEGYLRKVSGCSQAS